MHPQDRRRLPTRAQRRAHWTCARSSASSEKTCGMKNRVWVSNVLHPNTLVVPLLHSLCLRSYTLGCSHMFWVEFRQQLLLTTPSGANHLIRSSRERAIGVGAPTTSAKLHLHREGTATPHAARGKGRAQGRTTHAAQQGPSVRFRFWL